MEIKHDDYSVVYDSDLATATIAGMLELGGTPQYKPIADMLKKVAESKPSLITLDVQNLRFLNSSGITALMQLGIQIRKLKASDLKIIGSSKHSWQAKSLKNIQKFVPTAVLEFN
ncbi:hypothetical protein KFU94_27330 [Chloroflexi bacterium TSY]|nr:hypothetical protein [Chloroflexi bacterium TSY]